jgi:PRTRC genetic system protein C
MKVTTPTRKFVYNSASLPDPNPALSPQQVQVFYAAQYPELNNSEVEGPETKNGEHHYKFIRAVGSKGASAQELIEQAGQQCSDFPKVTNVAVRLLRAVKTNHGKPIPMPSEAFGFWG